MNKYTPKHYTEGKSIKTHDKIALVMGHIDKNPKMNGMDHADIFNMFKYFDRMGSKDGEPIEKDAFKCADYLTKLVCGKFLNEILSGMETKDGDDYEIEFINGGGETLLHYKETGGEDKGDISRILQPRPYKFCDTGR